MNVRQLKEILDTYPDDMAVVVDGYEDGYDDPTCKEVDVAWRGNIGANGRKDSWYYGAHAEIDRWSDVAPRRVLALTRNT